MTINPDRRVSIYASMHSGTCPRRSRLSLRANDSILSPMFAPIAAEPKGEFDISYLLFDLQVSQQRDSAEKLCKYETHVKPVSPVLHLPSFLIEIMLKSKSF